MSKNQIYGRDSLVDFMRSNPLESMYDPADDDHADPVNIISEIILLRLEGEREAIVLIEYGTRSEDALRHYK